MLPISSHSRITFAPAPRIDTFIEGQAGKSIKGIHGAGNCRTVRVAARTKVEFRAEVVQQRPASLLLEALRLARNHRVGIKVRIDWTMLLESVSATLKIHGAGSQRTSDMNRIFGKTWDKREPQFNCRMASEGIRLPPPVELPPSGQIDKVARMHLHLFRLADQIQHMRHGMRSDFEHDVARIAQHPDVERTMQNRRQGAVPGDRHMVDSAKNAATQVAPQPLVGLGEKEIMSDSDPQTPLLCKTHQRFAIGGMIAHRFFQEDIDAGIENGTRRLKMAVRRQENMHGVELLFSKHSSSDPYTLGTRNCLGERLRLGQNAIAHRHQFHVINLSDGLGMPIGNIAGT